MQPHRLAVVSNRLPAIVKQGENGPTIQSGSGGLVTALDPVLRDRGGAWIGWLGIPAAEPETEALFEDLLARRAARSGYALKPVSLLSEEIDKYYYGFANEILWPLFHDLPSRCHFEPSYWQAYETVKPEVRGGGRATHGERRPCLGT